MHQTDVDYGPLTPLIGTWTGDNGEDIAPEPDGVENNAYSETLSFDAAGTITNAEEQKMSVLRYHQQVIRIRDQKPIHDQVGYWLWEPTSNNVIQSLSIPRAVNLLAHGSVSKNTEGETTIKVEANVNNDDWSIQQSPFMHKKAKTTSYSLELKLSENQLEYAQTMLVDIYGKENFEHTDKNILTRKM